MSKKIKILLITTKGCEGCRIQNNLIKEAIRKVTIPIDYQIKDCFEIDKQTIIDNFITDYPATLIIKNDVVKKVLIGTKPVKELIQAISET